MPCVVSCPNEKGEGNLGGVAKSKEGLEDEGMIESDARDLEGGFHSMVWVVMLDQDPGECIGSIRWLDRWGRGLRRNNLEVRLW